jgi:hypothetical protein
LLSGTSSSSAAEAGNNKMANFMTIPFRPSDELDSWQTILIEKSPTPILCRSSASTTQPSPPWNVCTTF